MQLDEFISETMIQIVNGVIKGHNAVYQIGARVNPSLRGTNPQVSGFVPGVGTTGKGAHFIDFDIALIVAENQSGKAGVGIFAGSIGVGGTKESGSSDSSVSRIKFKLPLSLPEGFEAPLPTEPPKV